MLLKLMRPGAIAIALLALALFAAAACSDDDDDDANAQENSSNTELEARVQRAEVLAALNNLDATEFHAIDEELQEAEEIPTSAASAIERAHQVSSSTQWPDPLADKAETLNSTMVEFLDALEEEDLQASKSLATDTHAAWHDMEHDAYAWVAGEEIEEHEEGEADHGEEATEEATDGS